MDKESFKKVVTYANKTDSSYLSLRGEAVATSVLDNHDAARRVMRIMDMKSRRIRNENGERYFLERGSEDCRCSSPS